MRLLMFLVFSHYGLACKNGIIFQMLDVELYLLIPGVAIVN